MGRRIFCSLAILTAIAFPSFGSTPSGGVVIRITGFTVESTGWASYSCGGLCLCGSLLTGTHLINDGASGTIVSTAVTSNPYNGRVSAGTIYSHCYQSRLDVASSGGICIVESNTFHSATACAPPAPPPINPPDPIIICDDGSYSGNCSPIVINMKPGPYRLSGSDDPVDFDIDADGSTDRITWTARGSAVAFLAMDRNDNRTIDDGSELFGTATRLRSGLRAANGFEALNELDADGDGLVGALDASWPALLLWTDANHDGISQPHEIREVALSDVRAMETRYHWTGRRDAAGNFFRYRGLAHLYPGRRPIYDIYFHSVP